MGTGIHITWAPPHLRISDSTASYDFDFHHYCGPSRLNSDGEVSKLPIWNEKHHFWILFDKWMKGGKKTEETKHGFSIAVYE